MSKESYHFIGIGGIGMSALATILLQRNKTVTGSDKSPSSVTKKLQESGAHIFEGHSPSNVPPGATVVYSSAISPNHPEYQAALSQKNRLLHRSELLKELLEGYKSLLVTGTHGKTTTSSLLAHLLLESGSSPSYALGGILKGPDTNGSQGKSDLFVAEADESDGSFLKYPAFGAIITNLENDHLDYWGSPEKLTKGFEDFAKGVVSLDHLFWCADDTSLQSLKLKGRSYGFSEGADARITRWNQQGWGAFFSLFFEGKLYEDIYIPLIAKHNVLNGASVFVMGLSLGLSEKQIRDAFKTFKSAKRRMEKKGEVRGVIVYDDYAHHPTEILSTLQAAKVAASERRFVVVFQPHRYSRVRDCWDEFLKVFKVADVLIATDIYGAGESPDGVTTGALLFEAIEKREGQYFHFVPRESLSTFLGEFVRPLDFVITLGAGDVVQVADELLTKPIKLLRTALISGGRSGEHEVALSSAKNWAQSLNKDLYAVTNFLISKSGQWSIEGTKASLQEVVKALLECEICLPIMHGPYCEDGMMQGFLETLGLPYVGSDYRSCAITMDKAWTKRIVASSGVNVADFLEFTARDWNADVTANLKTVVEKFAFPFFIKPVHLGSTLGVFCVNNQQELLVAVDKVCMLDYKFLIEERVVGREIEFGFIGDADIRISEPAEIISNQETYTYEGKYGDSPTPLVLKVDLPQDVINAGKRAALLSYKSTGCSGLARIDFFLKDGDTWVLNEINPMPGCTKTSMYPKMWHAEGVTMQEVIDLVVISAFYKSRDQKKLDPAI